MANRRQQPVGKRGVTIRDVARVAGVSSAAVSYYLNGTARLSEETGQRIGKAVRELEYRPDPLARSLSLGRRDVIGLAAMMGSRPYTDLFFAEIMAGVADAALQIGWAVQLLPIRDDPATGLWPARVMDGVAGTLVLDWAAGYAPWKEIEEGNHPVVLVNSTRKGIPSVDVDHEEGGRVAAAHLCALGHRRIVILGASGPLEKRRVDGAAREFRRCGIEPEVILVESSVDRAREALGHVLARHPLKRPTAVFAVSDWIALAVIDEAGKSGVLVPFDLSIVGYDDSILAETSSPPLTTVRQPLREMGRVSVEMLQCLLKRERPASPRLAASLTMRSSTCEAKGSGRKVR
ncbi:MAG TPA: LacI family DNA-binding transcriptional regulator [Kiritimatiellia bacterium]|jgi:LacI family transcriptional regulator